jgi:hypothetical protein
VLLSSVLIYALGIDDSAARPLENHLLEPMQELLPPLAEEQLLEGLSTSSNKKFEHQEEVKKRRRRRQDDADADDDDEGDRRVRDKTLAPNRRRRANTLSRDQWASLAWLLLIVIGGSKFSFWLFVHAHDALCIAFDLSCKPKGY